MNTPDSHVDMQALFSGDLPRGQEKTAQDHLSTCAYCRADFESLQAVEAALRDVPREALLQGPPVGADLLLQRTLRQKRALTGSRNARGGPRQLRTSLATVASLAVALSVAGGVGGVIGYNFDDGPQAFDPGRPSTSSAPGMKEDAPGTTYASSFNPATGARLTVSVEPAEGFVRVGAAVTGIPVGERCRLVVESMDGEREIAGSWVISEKGSRDGATIEGSAILDHENVKSVTIENVQGDIFATATV
jgi:hypothetical protein